MSRQVTIQIRPEGSGDADGIRALHTAAFPTDAEARLVDRLRDRDLAAVSYVAVDEGTIIGHVLYSPVMLESAATANGLGLAPVAVLPSHQKQGIGAALIRESLAACRARGCSFVVVLGDPEYYPRFGFARASAQSLSNEYGADEAFMVIELIQDSLPAMGGLVRYHAEFAEWS